jgi:hypothetical protein
MQHETAYFPTWNCCVFQLLAVVAGYCARESRDMECRPLIVTHSLSTGPADPRTAGTGLAGIVRVIGRDEKLPRGKPSFGAKLRRDEIVGHVRHLQKLEPDRKFESITAEVKKFHSACRATVFNALQLYDQLGPDPFVDAGSVRGRRASVGKCIYLDSDFADCE